MERALVLEETLKCHLVCVPGPKQDQMELTAVKSPDIIIIIPGGFSALRAELLYS